MAITGAEIQPETTPRPLALTESIVLPEKVKSKGRPEEPVR